jgi:hypothetical protein
MGITQHPMPVSIRLSAPMVISMYVVERFETKAGFC